MARNEAKINSRITSTDNEGDYQTSVSRSLPLDSVEHTMEGPFSVLTW